MSGNPHVVKVVKTFGPYLQQDSNTANEQRYCLMPVADFQERL